MSRALLRSAVALALCVAPSGCDSAPSAPDSGPEADCAGASDGTACGSGMICIGGACAGSRCGDGFTDEAMGELCDDGNQVAFDGCEPGSCTFTCTESAECNDGIECNGMEDCDATAHVCSAGTPLGDGAACSREAAGDGVCRGLECVSAGCGNGVVDGGEDCDDGNMADGDGCDNDCTFSCVSDADCDDLSVCTGTETCDVATHACLAGEPMACSDGNACTSDECDAERGCVFPLIDEDGDGHAAEALGPCGDDCDDTRADVYAGAEELCDGRDNNCNEMTDETAPNWYVDCDRDGFAANTGGSVMSCTEPPSSATGCGGGWTSRRPVDSSNTDCRDSNATVRPNQTSYFTTAIAGAPAAVDFDYDCNGAEDRRYTSTNVSTSASCFEFCAPGTRVCSCIGATGWTGSTVPVCGETRDGGFTVVFTACTSVRGGGCARTRETRRTQECR